MKRWKWASRAFAYGTAVGAMLKLNFFTAHDRWDESAHSHILYGRYPAWMGPALGGWMSRALDWVVFLGLICAALFVIDLALAFSGRESWKSFLFSALAYVVSVACAVVVLLSALSGLR